MAKQKTKSKRAAAAVREAHEPDRSFLMLSGVLLVLGLIILTSASVGLAYQETGDSFFYIKRQLSLGLTAGLLGALIVQLIPVSWWRVLALPLFLGSLALLALVLVPGVASPIKGVSRWIGFGQITIQPSELLKITLPLYLAAWFSSRIKRARTKASRRQARRPRKKRSQKSQKGPVPASITLGEDSSLIAPLLTILGLLAVLFVLQPDISTFGILVIVAFAMYFLAGGSLRILALLTALGAAGALVLVRTAPYRMNRVLAFLSPEQDPLGIGYQINQALLAVGSGGFWGRGFGFSREKLFFLPEPMGDSIFAVFAEEAGFIGATFLILLFIAFAWRGFWIARRIPDPFLKLLTAGLVLWIVIQAFINIAGNIALGPLTGITLPFISYGSSSLAVALVSAGMIYKASRYTV